MILILFLVSVGVMKMLVDSIKKSETKLSIQPEPKQDNSTTDLHALSQVLQQEAGMKVELENKPRTVEPRTVESDKTALY